MTLTLIRPLQWRPCGGGAEGAAKEAETGRSEGAGEEVAVRVTPSIMIKRPAGCSSPANATPPISPFSGEDLVLKQHFHRATIVLLTDVCFDRYLTQSG